MNRSVSYLVAVVPALAMAAAPVPDEEVRPPLYFATRVGATWVYEWEQKAPVYTERVTKVERKDGAYLVTVARVTSVGVTPWYKYEVSNRGVFLLEVGKAQYDPKFCYVKLPAKPKDTWNIDTKIQGEAVRAKMTVRGVEQVEVPAGKYQALRVEHEIPQPDGTAKCVTDWYAPGVGVVKIAAGDASRVLKSFDPGKE